MLVFLLFNLDVYLQVFDSFLIAIGTLFVQTSIMPLELNLLSPLFIFLFNFLFHILLHLRHLMLKYHLLIFHLLNALLLKSLDEFEVIHFNLVHFKIWLCDLFRFKFYHFFGLRRFTKWRFASSFFICFAV